jgi:hypothetical protein
MKLNYCFLGLFLFIVMISGCNSNSNYYKKPIKQWLNQNLNDRASYEPVEFKVLDENSMNELIPTIGYGKMNVYNQFQRHSDIIEEILLLKYPPESDILKSEIKAQKTKFDSIIDIESYNGIITIKQLYENINSKILTLLNSYSDKANMDYLVIYAQFEGINDRVKTEIDSFDEKLRSIGSSKDEIRADLYKGNLIYHSYRANNAMGAKILNRMVFKLGYDNETVEKASDIE